MKSTSAGVGWVFWLCWGIAGLVGGGLAFAAALFGVFIGGGYFSSILVAIGMVIGQGFVLRLLVSNSGRWLLANIVVVILLIIVLYSVFTSTLDEADYSHLVSPLLDMHFDFLLFLTRALAVYVPVAGSALILVIRNNSTTRSRVQISLAGIVSGVLVGWLLGMIFS